MNRAPSDSDIKQLELIYNALSQAQDCINDEPPEGMTYQEARRDTVDKVREAMRTVEAMQSSPAPPSVLKCRCVVCGKLSFQPSYEDRRGEKPWFCGCSPLDGVAVPSEGDDNEQ